MITLFDLQTQSGQLWPDIAAHLATKDSELATTQAALTALEAFRDSMVEKVTTVLQSGDPEQYAALAVEFLTPEEEKIRAEKMAKIADLKAQAAAIEAELGI
jgi:precorrin-4 methylase